MTALLASALLAAGAAAHPGGGPALDAAPRALAPEDLDAARLAWRYFERNYQPATGLVNSVEGYPSTTQWDLGSSILATVAVRELGLLDADAFARRASAVLRTLAAQPLFEGALPNKAYDARTGAMTDYANKPAPRGIGASAVDIGRLASALAVLVRIHPQYQGDVERVLRRWDLCRLAKGGELQGAIVQASGEVQRVQEGRLGYEQYAGHGLAALGLDVSQAVRYDRYTGETDLLGVALPYDTRDRKRFGAVDALVTDPFVLDAFEFGLGPDAARIAQRVLEVQKRRWQATGVVTAASEDHVDRAPWFVYGAIWADGATWRAVTPEGEDASDLRSLSTKAAFALATLYPDDPYAQALRDALAPATTAQGFLAGVYERGGVNRSMNANTNGVVLEALLYKAVGPLSRAARADEEGVPRSAPAALAVASCPAQPHVERASLAGGGSAASGAGASAGASVASGSVPAGALAPGRAADEAPGFRVDGTLFMGYRGADGPTYGGLATVWPWRYLFLRLGAEATPVSKAEHGASRLLWGLGYDDWHPGTFFLHVDDWGPIRAADALTRNGYELAELNAGYRLPRVCLASSVCLAPLAMATVPYVGGPYVSARVNLQLGSDWFLMGGVGYTLPGVMEGPIGTPRWRVVYGLGRSTWAPGSLFVTYYDWGPSWRDRNGVVAIGINWGF